jgi:outer membrane protein TolC
MSKRLLRADRILTLSDAFTLGAQNNLDLSAARTHLEQSALLVRQAFSALLPQVNLQGKYTHNYREVTFTLPGAPASEAPITIQRGNALDSSLQFYLPLYSPAVFPGLDAAKQSDLVAKDSFTLIKTQVLFGVAQAFYAAAGTDELLAARKDAVTVAQETLNTANTRLANGVATRLDASRAELALVQAEKAADEAAEAQDMAYRGLSTLVQLRETFRVDSGPSAAPSAQVRPRPEIVVLQESIKLADMEAVVARRRWWPVLSAFGLGRLSNYAGFTGDKYSWALGLQLDWTIYDGGNRDVQAKQAEAQRVETEFRLKQQSDTVNDEIANARRAVETKTRSVVAAQRSVSLSKEALALVRVRYEAGQATQLDVLQGQDSVVLAEVGLAQTRFDLALSGLSLERATGSFLDHAEGKLSAAK